MPIILFMQKTKINKASSKHDQLRSTIPILFARQLNLHEGDSISWDLDKVDGEWVIIIKKL